MKTTWWSVIHTLEIGQSVTLRLGELRLGAERLDSEWSFYWKHGSPVEREPGFEPGQAVSNERAGVSHCRYPCHESWPALRFEPRLADRPLVVRPVTPLYVLPGETLTLWVSSPLWCRVVLLGGEGREIALGLDLPSDALSETWFGPDTLNGEVGYASQTRARLHADRDPADQAGHRARTPVVIHNEQSEILRMERLNLPLESCSLYEDPNGLITDTVVWHQPVRGQRGSIRLMAPASSPRVTGPRKAENTTVLSRAFGLLFE